MPPQPTIMASAANGRGGNPAMLRPRDGSVSPPRPQVLLSSDRDESDGDGTAPISSTTSPAPDRDGSATRVTPTRASLGGVADRGGSETADDDDSSFVAGAKDTATGDVAGRGVSFAALTFFDAGAEDDEDDEEEEEGAGDEKKSLLSLFFRGAMVDNDV